jgi:hypothetical protein
MAPRPKSKPGELSQILAAIKQRPSFKQTTERPWVPVKLLLKQQQFVDSDVHYLGYGGSVASGKSLALLAAALKYADVPGYHALILRKTFPELEGADGLIPLSREWLSGRANYSEAKRQWAFPSGATLTFGHVATKKDRYRFDGQQFGFIGFDEGDSFEFADFQHITTRCRTKADLGVPLRIRLTANPPTKGRLWVLHEFVNPGREGRRFIQTTIADNPYVEKERYMETLRGLDEATRRALLDGIWEVNAGGAVYPVEPGNLVFTPPDIEEPVYCLGIDLGASLTKPTTAFVLAAYSRRRAGKVWVLESRASTELSVSQMAAEIQGYVNSYPGLVVAMDAGALGASQVRTLRHEFGLPVDAARKTNKQWAQKLVRGALERRDVQILHDTNAELVDVLSRFRLLVDGSKEDDTFAERHLADAFLYAWRGCDPKTPRVDAPAEVVDRPVDYEHRQRLVEEATPKKKSWLRRKFGRYDW